MDWEKLKGFAPSPLLEGESGTGSSPGQTTLAPPEPSAAPERDKALVEVPEGTEAPLAVVTESPEPPKKDWKDARLAKQTARLHELQAKLDALEAGQVPGATVAPTLDVEAQVTARVAQLEFDRACNAVALEGRGAFPDFDSKVASLRELVNPNDPSDVVAYNTMLAAAIETGAGHEVLHKLGGDQNEAMRILALAPAKMAVELTKIALRAPEVAPTSAKPPLPSIGGRGVAAELIDPSDPARADKLPSPEWFRRRQEQVKAKRVAR